ncbi:MAG TPA: hypothetical protein VGV61_11350 [Thermoanaerobaculia bacterium]|jgi:hypothetical protein|nr:hypothetical protein [Thermoanaerobaculia bacterium]
MPRLPSRPRTVCFVKYYQKGSTDIAADQMADALRRHGVESRSLFASELGGVRDAALVFIKRADLAHLLLGRLQGNALVLDVHDTIVFRRGIRWAALYDGLIFRTERARHDFGGRKGVVIPHHWDERYGPHRAPLDRLRLAFIGHPRSYPFAPGELPGVELVFDDWFARAPAFNAHLSVRRPGREWLYKPNLKVATAAACGAVLIATPDVGTVEDLGEDYPFYTGPGREEVMAAMARAERLLGGPEWRRALELLAAVRERITLPRVTTLYVDFLQRFGALARCAEPAGTTALA